MPYYEKGWKLLLYTLIQEYAPLDTVRLISGQACIGLHCYAKIYSRTKQGWVWVFFFDNLWTKFEETFFKDGHSNRCSQKRVNSSHGCHWLEFNLSLGASDLKKVMIWIWLKSRLSLSFFFSLVCVCLLFPTPSVSPWKTLWVTQKLSFRPQ